jgi:uncharacterized damage-inducible protein DinB
MARVVRVRTSATPFTEEFAMDFVTHAFLDSSRRFLTQDFLPKIRLAVEPLSDEDIWWRPNESSNSIGNLMLHLAGNARQWIVSGVGGATDIRQRDLEFAQRDVIPRETLLTQLTTVVDDVTGVLGRLTAAHLIQKRTIQSRDVTVLAAIYHVVEHFSMHTGQIILIAKMRAPGAVKFYDDAQGLARPLWAEARGTVVAGGS